MSAIPAPPSSFSFDHQSVSREATEAFNVAALEFLRHGKGTMGYLDATLAHDSGLISAHALQGFGILLLAKPELMPMVQACLAKAEATQTMRGSTRFESTLVSALQDALAGHWRNAAARLESLIGTPDANILCLKLSHQLRFMSGDAQGMLAATTRYAQLHPDSPGIAYALGCHAFAFEELGHYVEAEQIGCTAAEQEPNDSWGGHAVAHVFEMTGRNQVGKQWIETRRHFWKDCNNFGFHIEWHYALFMLEAGDFDSVLRHYDAAIRHEQTDDFRDFSNAASMLQRLELAGINVGTRWQELADQARNRIQDQHLVFASLHHMLALIATHDEVGANQLLESLGVMSTGGHPDQSEACRTVGLPLARHLFNAAFRPEAEAADRVALARNLPRAGGSFAQRDVFLRTLIVDAVRAHDIQATEALVNLRSRVKSDDLSLQLAIQRANA